MRGKIYVEVFEHALFNNSVTVWNSWPKDYNDEYWRMKWDKLKIKWVGFLKGMYRKKNGPRYWAMDSALDCSNIKQIKKNFGVFSFIKRARIDKKSVKHAMTKKGLKPYYPIPVKRHTIWIYDKNKPIYFLRDDKNNIWLLQSIFSTTSSFELMDCKKEYLQNVRLPRDWSYHSYTPPKNICLPSIKKTAYILRDDLKNTFMKMHASLPFYKELLCIK